MYRNKNSQKHIKVFGLRNFKILKKLICLNNLLKTINKKLNIKILQLKLIKIIIIFVMIRDRKIKEPIKVKFKNYSKLK